MNLLDPFIVAFVLAAGFGGWRVGLVQRAAGWVGLCAAGAVALAFLGRSEAADLSDRSLFVVVGSFFAALAVGNLLGSLVGGRVADRLRRSSFDKVDRVSGAAFGVAGAILLAWVVPVHLAELKGRPAELARGSLIAGALVDVGGTPPDLLGNLRRALNVTDFPSVFAGLEPTPDAEPPPRNTPLDRAVAGRAAAATVRVRSRACDEVSSGTGWLVQNDLVVTNAHVVAGADADEIGVETMEGRQLSARLVAYDSGVDLAVLEVDGLDVEPLRVASPQQGDKGAVFGYPGARGLREDPFVVSRLVTARGRDIYGKEEIEREVLVIGSGIERGDSGGPLVDTGGNVIGIAFAVAPDRDNAAYAIDPSELPPLLATASARERVSAGACLAEG